MHETKEERYIRLIENALERDPFIDPDAIKYTSVDVTLTEEAAKEIIELLKELKNAESQRKSAEPLNDVIETLKQMYETALKMPFVFNPIAWALHQTWKVYDIKGKKKEINQ